MSLFAYVGFATFAVIWNMMVVCCIGCDRKLKSAFKLLLQMLLLTDIVLMVLNIFNVILVEFTVLHPNWIAADSEFRRVWIPYAAYYSLPGFYTAHTASVWMVLLISVDRFLAVHHQKVAVKYMSSKWQTGGAVLGVWIGSALINLPRFFEYKVSYGQGDVEATNRTTPVTFSPTWLLSNRAYNYVYNYCLYAIIMLILPFIILTFTHLKLASVTRQLRRRQPADNKSACGKCCGICTVSAPFTFIVCVLFHVSPVVVLVTKLVDEFSEVNVPALLSCSLIEFIFNAVGRFFIYLMFSRYVYVGACKLQVKSTAVFVVDVEKDCGEENGKVEIKTALLSSQPDLRSDDNERYSELPQMGGNEKCPTASEGALPGRINTGYDSALDSVD